MRDVFDIYTIISLALAIFIFLRLRNVLGQRTGRERPPYDSYSTRDQARSAGEKVVAVPANRPAESVMSTPAVDAGEKAESEQRWNGIAEPGSAIAANLDAIAAVAPDFDIKHFLTGARAAYEMIVNAFADGDRRILKNLLSQEVFEGFDRSISEREKRGEHMESHFVSIDSSDTVGAEIHGRLAQLTVRFHSKLISATRNQDGNVTEGSTDKVIEVTDVWTFARDVASRDPNWKLVATEAEQ
jgi:predicted lipid-binding transport protein (Tim44 family)